MFFNIFNPDEIGIDNLPAIRQAGLRQSASKNGTSFTIELRNSI